MPQKIHYDGKQDWDQVVFSKAPVTNKQAKEKGNVANALRSGTAEVAKKEFRPGNKVGVINNAKQLDEDHDTFKNETVSRDFSKALMQARLAKKMTQAQLAQQINEKPQVIQTYENGSAIPNGQVVGKLGRILGVNLPTSRASKVAKAKPKAKSTGRF